MSVVAYNLVCVSSLALYRRYRPESFAEVIGQEHVTDPLQQALRNNRVNHAYLFSGPRGCGKTTSARILARCLNCEQGPTPTPCGECQSCRDLARNGPGSIDVIEIDAASHGGVDDARDLREKAFFGPAGSRYKIYIIDEAHMVTSAGFNALLKVVEEPPEHLKFIFATTEPEKVIGTIRSRTHHYPFRLVPPGTLREYLGEVCQKEGIPVEDGVLPLVVRSGAGSVRDSMSVMDQLLAGASDAGVTYAMATSLLGYTEGSLLDSVVEAFATGDGAAAFEVVDRIIEGATTRAASSPTCWSGCATSSSSPPFPTPPRRGSSTPRSTSSSGCRPRPASSVPPSSAVPPTWSTRASPRCAAPPRPVSSSS